MLMSIAANKIETEDEDGRLRIAKTGRASISLNSATSRRHSRMEGWNPGYVDVSGGILRN
jgi:hypothetical protein